MIDHAPGMQQRPLLIPRSSMIPPPSTRAAASSAPTARAGSTAATGEPCMASRNRSRGRSRRLVFGAATGSRTHTRNAIRHLECGYGTNGMGAGSEGCLDFIPLGLLDKGRKVGLVRAPEVVDPGNVGRVGQDLV